VTRKEITGTRELKISGWIRKKLPDSSTGFLVSDLDFIIWNYKTRRLMLIEIKTRKAVMRPWQSNLFYMLDKIINKGINGFNIKYYGFHCIRFEGTSFDDGRCMFDKKYITETDLIKTLSMVI
jgi:hypothetical protein